VGLAVQNAKLYSSLEKTTKELQIVNDKLKELDERKDEFLNIAAHELRAPMTAIKGYLSMIMEGDAGAIPPQVSEFLSEAATSNDRLIRLVNNMLNTARIEENRQVYTMAVVDLLQVVQTVFKEFQQDAMTKKLVYTANIVPGTEGKVYVDADRIHEVVGNFISNAIKYTDEGSVTVTLSNPNSGTIQFEVADTGPGIPADSQARLFEKFYRVETDNLKRAPGTGLGLYISKLLVEKFGGKLGFKSESGKGSSFWFELPIAKAVPDKPNIMV
jgi:signal transduction histidine kinase